MSEQLQESARSAFEERSRTLFHDSVENVDMRVRSRLNQARHAALDAADASGRRPWIMRLHGWTPATGVVAAAVLGVSLWFGNLTGSVADQPNLEDLDIVTASDGNTDAMEMLQDDLEFYDFADKAANPEPSA
jgi:negative regulator of sigma E activity